MPVILKETAFYTAIVLVNNCFVNQMLPQGQGPDEFLSPVEFFLSDSSAFIHNRWHFTAQTIYSTRKTFPSSDKES